MAGATKSRRTTGPKAAVREPQESRLSHHKSNAPEQEPAAGQANIPLTLHVVSHTHWDREWYLPYQRFRMRLVEMIDNVLHTLDTQPSFRSFQLDGQTIVLEDYLEIRPQNEEKIRNYVRNGRLIVGPWYQLMDEFLVSGESIIRSLLIGSRIARDFGASMPVGYLADQFGNISQMPQIFQGFGIDNCVFGRGVQLTADQSVEFTWRGPDGSEVLCSLMAWWYNNAQRFPADPQAAQSYIKSIATTMEKQCSSGHLLLMNGVDHLDVQEDVGPILEGLASGAEGLSVLHSTLESYIACVRRSACELPMYEGEMREDRGGSILAGVLSTRLYLKQANSRCETLLERVTEPLAALGWLHGQQYDRDFIRYAWKRLMWNHPHDSICGCSDDQVHREMAPRFAEVEQVGEELALRAAHGLTERMNVQGPALVVFNTLGFARTDLVEAEVDFPLGAPSRDGRRPAPTQEVDRFSLWDADGEETAFQIMDVETTPQMILSPTELPMTQWVKRFKIKFVAEDVPPVGYCAYRIDTERAASPAGPSLVPYANAMENESLLVEIAPDGTLHILQKSTERDYEGCLSFEDCGDCGDEYHSIRPLRDELICTERVATAQVSLVESGPVAVTYRIDLDLELPASLSSDQRGRSGRRVRSHVSSLVSLSAGSSRVEVHSTIRNNSQDHRLRVLFPTGIGATTASAEGQFDVLSRPSRAPAEWIGASSSRPQQSFVDVSDGADGLCILNRGLTEYEFLDDQFDTLAVTLLRSVGQLSVTGDGPAIPTPEAQCLGINEADYAIYPHAGTWLDARTWQEGHAFRTPMLCVQRGAAYAGEIQTLQRQDWRHGKSAGESLRLRKSFLAIAPDEVVLSALKLAEDRDVLLARVYNISAEPVTACLRPGFRCNKAWRLNLDEVRGGELTVSEAEIRLELRPNEIATFEFEIKKDA